jgi:hypothetical protein
MTPQPPVRAPQPGASPTQEGTRWSWGLVGFYLSCAGTALGATFAAAGYLWFESIGWLVFGSALAVTSIVTCFVSLHAARRPRA